MEEGDAIERRYMTCGRLVQEEAAYQTLPEQAELRMFIRETSNKIHEAKKQSPLVRFFDFINGLFILLHSWPFEWLTAVWSRSVPSPVLHKPISCE